MRPGTASVASCFASSASTGFSGPTTGMSAWRIFEISAASMSRWTTVAPGANAETLPGDAVVEARADRDDQVGLVQREVRPLRPVHAGPADVQLVRLGEAALRHQRRHDRQPRRLGEPEQLVGRVARSARRRRRTGWAAPPRRSPAAAATVWRGCPRRGGFQPGRVTSSGYEKSSSASWMSRGMSTSTGPQRPVRRDVERGLDHVRDLVDVLHEPRVLDDRDRDPGDVALLERVGADQDRAHLARDADERRRVHPRVGDRRDEVRRARARRRERRRRRGRTRARSPPPCGRRPARGARGRGGRSCRARWRRRSGGSRRPAGRR